MGQISVQEAAVVTCPFGTGSAVRTLNFHIVCAVCGIQSQNVQPDGTALQIFQIVLTVYFLYRQVITVQNDAEQQCGTRFVFKNLAHEIIVHEPEAADPFKVFHMLLLECCIVRNMGLAHRITCFLLLLLS